MSLAEKMNLIRAIIGENANTNPESKGNTFTVKFMFFSLNSVSKFVPFYQLFLIK